MSEKIRFIITDLVIMTWAALTIISTFSLLLVVRGRSGL